MQGLLKKQVFNPEETQGGYRRVAYFKTLLYKGVKKIRIEKGQENITQEES